MDYFNSMLLKLKHVMVCSGGGWVGGDRGRFGDRLVVTEGVSGALQKWRGCVYFVMYRACFIAV